MFDVKPSPFTSKKKKQILIGNNWSESKTEKLLVTFKRSAIELLRYNEQVFPSVEDMTSLWAQQVSLNSFKKGKKKRD